MLGIFGLGPLERTDRAVDVKTLPVLPCDRPQVSGYLDPNIAGHHRDVGRLQCERRPVTTDHPVENSSGSQALDGLRFEAGRTERRADGVCRVVHWRHAIPVRRPPGHVLVVRRPEELQFAERTLDEEVLQVKELPAVDPRPDESCSPGAARSGSTLESSSTRRRA